MSEESINRLTGYRLKNEDLDALSFAGYEQVEAGVLKSGNSSHQFRLFFRNRGHLKDASWFAVLSPLVPKLPVQRIPKVLNAGFILAVKIGDSIYGVCGGLGHFELRKHPIEQRFGIVIAQKILSLPELKGLVQKDTSGDVNYLNRAFRSTYNPQNDLSNLKRVLTHVRGKLESKNKYCETIGKSILAGDALSANGRKTLRDIVTFLIQVEKVWKMDTPGLNIPQLEHIRKKYDYELLEHLEKELVVLLTNFSEETTGKFYLDNTDIGYLPDRVQTYELRYARTSYSTGLYEEIFRKVAEQLMDVEDKDRTEEFRKMKVKLTFDDDQTDTIELFHLICGDITYQDNVYFLTDGLWYRANEEYLRTLAPEIDNIDYIKSEDLSLNEWIRFAGQDAEKKYNLSHNGQPSLHVLDRRLIHIAGEKGGIELCDILGVKDRTYLVHVKKAKGAELRALFAQGFVSAKLYSNHPEFRNKVHTAGLSANGAGPLSAATKRELANLSRKRRRDLTVVFAIFDNTPSHQVRSSAATTSEYLENTLTTFAKVDLLDRATTLRAMGYDVAVTRIKPHP